MIVEKIKSDKRYRHLKMRRKGNFCCSIVLAFFSGDFLFLFSLAFPFDISLAPSQEVRRAIFKPNTNILLAKDEGDLSMDKDEMEPFRESFTIQTIQLKKPMGIILEEIDETDSNAGVQIKQIDPHGQTALACSRDASLDICIRDRIIAINDEICASEPFESIMEKIIESPNPVTFTLARLKDATVITWPNGISVASSPGDSFGNIARSEALVSLQYSCSNGGCGTCEQSMIIEEPLREDNGFEKDVIRQSQRYIRPCVARVPKLKDGTKITVAPSDRYEPC